MDSSIEDIEGDMSAEIGKAFDFVWDHSPSEDHVADLLGTSCFHGLFAWVGSMLFPKPRASQAPDPQRTSTTIHLGSNNVLNYFNGPVESVHQGSQAAPAQQG